MGFEPTVERNPTPVFKTGALNRSATHPTNYIKGLAGALSPEYRQLAPKWHPIVLRSYHSGLALDKAALMTSAARSSVLLNRCP